MQAWHCTFMWNLRLDSWFAKPVAVRQVQKASEETKQESSQRQTFWNRLPQDGRNGFVSNKHATARHVSVRFSTSVHQIAVFLAFLKWVWRTGTPIETESCAAMGLNQARVSGRCSSVVLVIVSSNRHPQMLLRYHSRQTVPRCYSTFLYLSCSSFTSTSLFSCDSLTKSSTF